MNEKDINDTVVLFLEHEIGDADDKLINSRHISRLVADDWVFYHTLTINRGCVEHGWADFRSLSADHRAVVRERISRLRRQIEAHPKSLKWRLRSGIAARIPWHQTVEPRQ